MKHVARERPVGVGGSQNGAHGCEQHLHIFLVDIEKQVDVRHLRLRVLGFDGS